MSRSKQFEPHHRSRNRGRNRIPYRCGFSLPDFDCGSDTDPDPDRLGAGRADDFGLRNPRVEPPPLNHFRICQALAASPVEPADLPTHQIDYEYGR
jgi:hypothetical protein